MRMINLGEYLRLLMIDFGIMDLVYLKIYWGFTLSAGKALCFNDCLINHFIAAPPRASALKV